MSVIFFLLGFASLLSQVILFREMAIVFQGHELALGIGLAAWLLWGGVGSAISKNNPTADPRQTLSLILSYLGLILPITDILIRLSKLLLAEGSIPGFAASLIWPFVILAAPCWLIGRAFRVGVLAWEGRAGRIYFMESLGAAAGGIVSVFILVGRVPSFWTLAVLGGFVSAAGWWVGKFRCHPVPLIPIVLNIFFCLSASKIDMGTRRVQWREYEVIAQKETRYDHVLLAGLKESRILFQNGVIIAQNPDAAGQEEMIHWPLLAHPHPKRVLAIGLPMVFSLGEINKHQVQQVDFVEPDQQAVRFLGLVLTTGQIRPVIPAKAGIQTVNLPQKNVENLDPRSSIQTFEDKFRGDDDRGYSDRLLSGLEKKAAICQDPRQWIKLHPKEYDVIIQSLPDPANAALNRFFTREFFREARAALKEGGILAFSVSSSENYLPADIALENKSILDAVKSEFPHVQIIPGSRMRILASEKRVDLAPKLLSSRYAARKISNLVVRPETIPYFLDPARREYVWMKINRGGKIPVNTDLKPISYALAWKVWFSKFSSPWFFVGPLIIMLVMGWTLQKLWTLRKRPRESPEIGILFLAGFGGMVLEVAGLLLYQSLSGALYWQLGLLNAAFMSGLTGGSGLATRLKIKRHMVGIIGITGVMGIFAALAALNIEKLLLFSSVQLTWVFILFLFIPGFLVGAAFSWGAAGLPAEGVGRLYASDLWGSALGAFLAGAFFIPIFGFRWLLIITGISLILLPLLALRR